MRAIFLDCKTGGLEPATDALCSIGAVVFDTDAADVDECILARAHWPICVPHDSPLRVSPEALRVQGFTRDDLADSGRLWEGNALRYLHQWWLVAEGEYQLRHADPWMWSAAFDRAFLGAASGRCGGGWARHRVLCAQNLAWGLQELRLGPSAADRRLMHWALAYGLTQPEPHNAQADAEVAAKVLWHLVRTLKGGA